MSSFFHEAIGLARTRSPADIRADREWHGACEIVAIRVRGDINQSKALSEVIPCHSR